MGMPLVNLAPSEWLMLLPTPGFTHSGDFPPVFSPEPLPCYFEENMVWMDGGLLNETNRS